MPLVVSCLLLRPGLAPYSARTKVNKAWAGLGYYRRAKMLHLGAQKVMADHGGSLPSTAKELKDLPGIGPYTAGTCRRPPPDLLLTQPQAIS